METGVSLAESNMGKLTSGAMYRFVPTRLLSGISTVSVATSCLTARPKSPMAHVVFDFTKIFFDLRSL